jgi:hypothetical protein
MIASFCVDHDGLRRLAVAVKAREIESVGENEKCQEREKIPINFCVRTLCTV